MNDTNDSPGNGSERAFRRASAAIAHGYLRTFLNGFCRYLPLPLVLLLLLGLITGTVAREMGVMDLILGPSGYGPFVGGVSGFFFIQVVVAVLFLGFVLFQRDQPAVVVTANGGILLPFLRYSAAVLVGIVATGAVLWGLSSVFESGSLGLPTEVESNPTRVIPFLCGVGLGLAFAFGCLAVGSRRRRHPAAVSVPHLSSRSARRVFAGLGLILGLGAVAVVGSGQLFPQDTAAGESRRTIWATALIAVGLVSGAIAGRWGGAAGAFYYFVTVLFAGHLVITWVAYRTSGSWVGGWWAGGVLAVALGTSVALALRKGFPAHVKVLLGDHDSHIGGAYGARLHRAGMLLFGVIVALFVLVAKGLSEQNWVALRNPAVSTFFLLYLVVGCYAVFTYVIPSQMRASVVVAAVLLILGGGIPGYKYQVRYDGTPDGGLDYRQSLDLQTTLEAERERQWNLNEAARGLGEVRGDSLTADQARRLTELRTQYAADDRHQRIIPLKLFTPKLGTPSGVTAEFPPSRPGREPLLLRPEDLGFAGRGPRGGGKGPLVLIAVSGGAMRAAAWTHAILSELELAFEDHGIDFPAHVRIIAGASGGMLGAGHYVTELQPREARRGDRRKALADQYNNLVKDCLTPLIEQMVFGDIPNTFSPWPRRYDRGVALEDTWKANGLDRLTRTTFAQLRGGERDGWRPSLVVSPMMVEDGRRLLFSNLDMRYVVSNDGALVRPEDRNTVPKWPANYSREAFEFFRLFPGEADELSVATAIRLSASFPVFSPAPVLPTTPRRRIVDAGYYDNYGVSLAASWLFSGAHADWISEHASKILIIQIRAYESDPTRTLGRWNGQVGGKPVFAGGRSTLFGRSLEDVTTPVVGVNQAREAAMSFRNDEQLEQLHRSMQKEFGVEFNVLNLELDLPEDRVPLNWFLTTEQSLTIRENASHLLSNIPARTMELPPDKRLSLFQKLLTWWKAGK